MNEKVKIVYLAVKDLIPYANNPRINEAAVEFVAKSIKEYGFKVPILLDGDNVIIAGHTRLKAALKLGMDEVPCIMCDDLTPSQVKAFRLVDNKTAEFADWDLEKLQLEIKDIDFNMEEFGFFELPEINIDDYLVDKQDKPISDNEPERIQCPHCGEWFEKP